jgi:hypothetical protein
LAPNNTLPGWTSGTELAAGIVPGCLHGNGKGYRGDAMIELPKIPVEKLS